MEGYQIEAQTRGWKNKLHNVSASSFDDARRQAREFFEGPWVFRVTRHSDAVVEMDEGFDPTWEEP